MSKKLKLILGGLLVVAIIAGFQIKSRLAKTATIPTATSSVKTIEFATNDIAKVSKQNIAHTLPISGSFNPVKWAYVKSQVAGEISEVLVREGATVKKDQIIARMDTRELQARVQERIGNLEASRAQQSMAEKNQSNNQELLNKNFISQNAFDSSQSNYLQAKGAVKASEAQLTLAKKSLSDAIIRAPIAGVIAERSVQAGEKVAIDVKLFTVMDLSKMELAASIPAAEISEVKLGQAVTFRVEGFNNRQFEGHIDRINPSTQSGSRSILIYAIFNNTDGALKGGMFGTGQITVSEMQSQLTIPIDAVYQEKDGAFVYLIDKDILKKQRVKLGVSNSSTGQTQVLEGLAEGNIVVSRRFDDIREGTKVRVSKAASSS